MVLVTGMLHSNVCFQGIKSSFVPHLQHERKTSVGLLVPAFSCGLLHMKGSGLDQAQGLASSSQGHREGPESQE